MGLIQVATTTVTSPTASVILTGIDDNSVYMCVVSNVSNNSGNYQLRMRVANGGTQDSSADYDYASKQIRTISFGNNAVTNATFFGATTTGTATNEVQNYIFYFYNWYDASEYSFWTIEETSFDSNSRLTGEQGGCVFTQAERHDSVRFFTGNSVSSEYDTTQGTFTLYKVI
tara:strand:+ start:554 stop:1069 length:516 start_codon:yes stop_codon:yes gene_type:complete